MNFVEKIRTKLQVKGHQILEHPSADPNRFIINRPPKKFTVTYYPTTGKVLCQPPNSELSEEINQMKIDITSEASSAPYISTNLLPDSEKTIVYPIGSKKNKSNNNDDDSSSNKRMKMTVFSTGDKLTVGTTVDQVYKYMDSERLRRLSPSKAEPAKTGILTASTGFIQLTKSPPLTGAESKPAKIFVLYDGKNEELKDSFVQVLTTEIGCELVLFDQTLYKENHNIFQLRDSVAACAMAVIIMSFDNHCYLDDPNGGGLQRYIYPLFSFEIGVVWALLPNHTLFLEEENKISRLNQSGGGNANGPLHILRYKAPLSAEFTTEFKKKVSEILNKARIVG